MRIAAWLGTTVTVAALLAVPVSSAVAAPAGSIAASTAGTAATTTADAAAADATVADVCAQPARPGWAQCMAQKLVPAVGAAQPMNSGVGGYSPADLASAYHLDTNKGAGRTVAIVDAYDDPTAAADLAVYRSHFNLPPCTVANGCFTKVAQDGSSNYPAANNSWSGEITLDLDMVSAICPQCHILLVEAKDPSFDDLGAAVDTAVQLGAKFVSNSYGAGEWDGENWFDSFYNHPGVAITVSTGDDGYQATYPASSPYVTAVGGTTLSRANNGRGWSETAWNGAMSGCSAYEAKPSFQSSTNTGCSMRAEADVSADADPYTGVAVYGTTGMGGWSVYGGTSAAAPIIAGTYALAGLPGASDYPNTYPYADPSALNDAVGGNNGSCSPKQLCTAVTGWDGPTGLGTPDGTAAFSASATSAPTLGAVNVSLGVVGQSGTPTVCAGAATQVQATVTDAATGVPVPGVAVTLSSTSSTGTSTTITTRTTNNQGQVSATVTPSAALTLDASSKATTAYAAGAATSLPVTVNNCVATLNAAADRTTVPYRGTVNVAGTLFGTDSASSAQAPMSGARVIVVDTPTRGRAAVLGTATVASNGSFAARVRPSASGELSVLYAPAGAPSVAGDVGPITVGNWWTRLSLHAPTRNLTAGVRHVVRGTLVRSYGSWSGAAPGVRVRIYLTARTGRRTLLATATTTARGTFRVTVRPKRTGSLTAAVASVTGYRNTESSPLVIRSARHSAKSHR